MPQAQCIELAPRLELLIDAFAPDPVAHIFNTPDFFRLHSRNIAGIMAA